MTKMQVNKKERMAKKEIIELQNYMDCLWKKYPNNLLFIRDK